MFNTTEQGPPAMERRFRDAQQGDELFHRHGQTGLQVVQLPNRESDAEDFDQFGWGEIRCRDFGGWAMHAEVDHVAGFIAPPRAAFALGAPRAGGFLRPSLCQCIAHLILLIVSLATDVNSLIKKLFRLLPS